MVGGIQSPRFRLLRLFLRLLHRLSLHRLLSLLLLLRRSLRRRVQVLAMSRTGHHAVFGVAGRAGRRKMLPWEA